MDCVVKGNGRRSPRPATTNARPNHPASTIAESFPSRCIRVRESTTPANPTSVPLPSPLIALPHHLAQVSCRPDLKRTKAAAHRRMLRHQLNRVLQVPRLENQDPADLFFGLRVRAVGHHHL